MPGQSPLLAITVFTPALAGCLLLLSWLQHRKVTALALWGSGFITASVATTLIIILRGTIPDFWSIIIGNALLAGAYGIMWGGARTFDGKNVSILLASTGVVFWLIACSIDPIYARPEARATPVMAAIGIVYTLLVVFELWRGRGDEVWRWPIMVLLLAHAAAIPIHIPLAGAWADPDPSDPSELDLLTFAIFEGAFVCICASRRPSFCLISIASKAAATILYAARGRLIPFNSNSPTGSTFTAFSTFVSTRGLIRICPGLASSHSREATLDTVPMAAESKRPSNRRCRRG